MTVHWVAITVDKSLLRLGPEHGVTLFGSAQVQTTFAKEAFVAGIDNGIKPLNAAALQYVDQVRQLESACATLPVVSVRTRFQ